LARRRRGGRVATVACLACAALALAPLVALVAYALDRGAGALSLGFLTHPPVPAGVAGGGISTALVGSARILGLAVLMAVPVALLAAMFLYERSGRLAAGIRFGADVLTGVPSIVLGIFAYAVLVRPLHHFSDLAASFALGVLMLPVMVRADEEAMKAVATDLWEAGVALGASRGRVARSVALRGCVGGLVSGNLLALSRAAGETAPLLFTVAAPTTALTLLIFTDGTQAFRVEQRTAWAAATVLLIAVLALSALARLVAWRLGPRREG
ncbi:MAG: phosphate ABC transporter permease PstA, partial [Acidimicrobiales bacterium]